MKTQWVRLSAPFSAYEVSECGNVRRAIRGRTRFAGHPVKGRITGGYVRHKLMKDDGTKAQVWAHRLVAEAFHGEQPSPAHIVAHWDGDKLNNHFSNLRWATARENYDDSVRLGTQRGERNGRARLTEADVITARRLYEEGEKVARIARRFGMSSSGMHSVVKRQNWGHVNG